MNEILLNKVEEGLEAIVKNISSNVDEGIIVMGASDEEFISELLINKLSKKANYVG